MLRFILPPIGRIFGLRLPFSVLGVNTPVYPLKGSTAHPCSAGLPIIKSEF